MTSNTRVRTSEALTGTQEAAVLLADAIEASPPLYRLRIIYLGWASQPAPPDTSGYEGEASRAAVQSGVDRATATARRGVASSGYSLGPPIYTGPVM